MLWRGGSRCDELSPSAKGWPGIGCPEDVDNDPCATSCGLSSMKFSHAIGYGNIVVCRVGNFCFLEVQNDVACRGNRHDMVDRDVSANDYDVKRFCRNRSNR